MVHDVTSVGQRSSPWPWNSVKVLKGATPFFSAELLVRRQTHFLSVRIAVKCCVSWRSTNVKTRMKTYFLDATWQVWEELGGGRVVPSNEVTRTRHGADTRSVNLKPRHHQRSREKVRALDSRATRNAILFFHNSRKTQSLNIFH